MRRLLTCWPSLLIYTLLFIAGISWALSLAPSAQARQWLGVGGAAAAGLITALGIVLITRRGLYPNERRTWLLLAAGAFVFSLTMLYWLVCLHPWSKRLLLPSWGFAGIWLAQLLLWIGLLLRPGQFPERFTGRLVVLCDIVLSAGAMTVIAQQVGIYPLIFAGATLASRLLRGGYAVLILGCITVLVLVASRAIPRSRRAAHLLVLGAAVVLLAGDLLFAFALLWGRFPVPATTLLTWAGGYLIFLAAIACEVQGLRTSQQDSEVIEYPMFAGVLAPALLIGTLGLLSAQLGLSPDPITPAKLRFTVTTLSIFLVLTLARLLLASAWHRMQYGVLRRQFDERERLALSDALTGLPNRRYLLKRLEEELSRARRYNRPCALIFADLDFFKMVNDLHGHAVGDLVLQTTGAALRKAIRISDVITRYGGEEFVLILPETTLAQGALLAERLRHLICEQCITLPGGQRLRVSMSFGVAAYPETADSLDELLATADTALGHAKDAGRNRVLTAEARQTLYVVN